MFGPLRARHRGKIAAKMFSRMNSVPKEHAELHERASRMWDDMHRQAPDYGAIKPVLQEMEECDALNEIWARLYLWSCFSTDDPTEGLRLLLKHRHLMHRHEAAVFEGLFMTLLKRDEDAIRILSAPYAGGCRNPISFGTILEGERNLALGRLYLKRRRYKEAMESLCRSLPRLVNAGRALDAMKAVVDEADPESRLALIRVLRRCRFWYAIRPWGQREVRDWLDFLASRAREKPK